MKDEKRERKRRRGRNDNKNDGGGSGVGVEKRGGGKLLVGEKGKMKIGILKIGEEKNTKMENPKRNNNNNIP